MPYSGDRTRYVVHRYYWPVGQFMIWRFIMYGTAGTLIGVFASFLTVQQQLQIGIPW